MPIRCDLEDLIQANDIASFFGLLVPDINRLSDQCNRFIEAFETRAGGEPMAAQNQIGMALGWDVSVGPRGNLFEFSRV